MVIPPVGVKIYVRDYLFQQFISEVSPGDIDSSINFNFLGISIYFSLPLKYNRMLFLNAIALFMLRFTYDFDEIAQKHTIIFRGKIVE